jgi:hypothetical protein
VVLPGDLGAGAEPRPDEPTKQRIDGK